MRSFERVALFCPSTTVVRLKHRRIEKYFKVIKFGVKIKFGRKNKTFHKKLNAKKSKKNRTLH